VLGQIEGEGKEASFAEQMKRTNNPRAKLQERSKLGAKSKGLDERSFAKKQRSREAEERRK